MVSRRSRSTNSVAPCEGNCGARGISPTSLPRAREFPSSVIVTGTDTVTGEFACSFCHNGSRTVSHVHLSAQQIPSGDRPSGNIHGTRSPAVGRRGMIATSQTLASAAGLKVLQAGGNAIDAAVTAAAVLAVDRAEHERDRRRPARARLRRENQEGLRPRFDRPLRARRHAGRVREARPHRNAGQRPARRRRARRRRRLAPTADAIRHDRPRQRDRAGDRVRA